MATRLNQLQTAFRRISILRSKWPDGDMSFKKLADSLDDFTLRTTDDDEWLLCVRTREKLQAMAFDLRHPAGQPGLPINLTPRQILERLDDIHNRIHDEWAAERDAKANRKAPKTREEAAHSARMTFVDGRWVIATLGTKDR